MIVIHVLMNLNLDPEQAKNTRVQPGDWLRSHWTRSLSEGQETHLTESLLSGTKKTAHDMP